MREDWTKGKLEDLLDYIQPQKFIVKSIKYSDSYKTPVLTAGKSFIKGYTNETDNIFDELPTIIFDDFTTATQFVNFKFKVKSSAMKILVPTSDLVNMKYVFYFMQTIRQNTDTHKRYWISKFSKLSIKLAPLPEQHTIVSKIEQLFSELDNGIANLKTAKDKLEIYRQAVLKKAFEGELTKEWREQQTDLSTADELLEQIKDERLKHYENQLSEWEEAVANWEANGKQGKKPTKPKKMKEFPELTREEISELHNIPKTAVWVRLGDVVYSVKDGPHYSPKYSSTGIPFVSGGNIRPSGIDFENVKFISEDLHVELSKRCKPELDDVLYTKGGTTGIARVNTYEKEFNVWVHVAVLKVYSFIFPFYLQHVLNSNHCYQQSQKYTHGVGNQDLGLTRMVLITLPLYSRAEQYQIVQKIESRLSVCDNILANIEEGLNKSEALRQSILKQAFEGKLLSEEELGVCRKEEDWEPAEELLERIKKSSKQIVKHV